MSGPARRALAVFAVAGLLHCALAGWGSLFNETDGQYGGAAKVMAAGGSWLVPENNGVPRLVKPPLLYWMIAGGMRAFGTTEFAARLPGALALAALATLAFLTGREWEKMGKWTRERGADGDRLGLIAAAILTTAMGGFTLGRIVMPEPVFSAAIAASLYCVLRAADPGAGSAGWWRAGIWIFGGVAAFVKGPHGLLYPLGIGGLALVAWGGLPALRRLVSLPGMALAGLLNVPWYVIIEGRYPGFLANLIFVEHAGHVAGSPAPATAYTNVPRLQFLALHAAWFFPWSVAVAAAIFRIRSFVGGRPTLAGWMVGIWAVGVLGSVLLAGQRQDYYAMAMWPAFALGGARLLVRGLPRAAGFAVAGLLAAALAACVAAPIIAGRTAPVAERATALLTVSQFGPEVWSGLLWVAVLALVPGILFALAAALHPARGIVYLSLCGVSVGIGAVGGTARVAPYFSLAEAAPAIRLEAAMGAEVVFDGGIDTASSLLFYTDSRVWLIDSEPLPAYLGRVAGTDPRLDGGAFRRLWAGGSRVLFVVEASRLGEWKLDPSPRQIATSGTLVVVSNRPAPQSPNGATTVNPAGGS